MPTHMQQNMSTGQPFQLLGTPASCPEHLPGQNSQKLHAAVYRGTEKAWLLW